MPSGEIDLDVLASGYKFRPPTAAGLNRARDAARRSLDPLLDVGGGPGHHANEWGRMGRAAVMVDVSAAMIESARSHEHVSIVRADAQNLPFASDRFGLAYFHQSIQYGNWKRSLAEAVRVVRAGGRIEIWTFDPARMGSSSLGRWFPSIAAIDEPRFPEPTEIAEFLGSMTASVETQSVDEVVERTASAWIEAVRGRFVSSLQVVPDDELEDGIQRFREQYRADDDIYRYRLSFRLVSSVV